MQHPIPERVSVSELAQATDIKPEKLNVWLKLAAVGVGAVPMSLALKVAAVAVMQRDSPATKVQAEQLFADLLKDDRSDEDWMVLRVQRHKPGIVDPPIKIQVTGGTKARPFIFDPLRVRDRLAEIRAE